ncbi:MAG: S24 family peptidase [Pseudomonadota bacterium]
MEHLTRKEREARGRLQDLVREKRTSFAALSRLLKRNSAYLQQYATRGSPRHLDEPDLRKIAAFLGVSPRVIETRGDNGEAGEGAAGSRTALPKADRDEWLDVPRLALDASAGPGAVAAEEISYDSFRFSRRWLLEQGLERSDLSIIRVDGDSMEPLLNDGDEILVDRAPRTFRDGVHVVRLGDTLMVKRVASAGAGRFSLLSQNLSYPPVSVEAEDLEIIGRVVWKGGRI